jgi:UrcA family protein
VGDLNLHSSAGRAQFDARVSAAARQACWDYRELPQRRACVTAFREEANENLSTQIARLQGMSVASARR